MISRLDRYVARFYLSSWLVSMVFFMGLFTVYKFFADIDELIERSDQAGMGPGVILRLYLYQAPDILLKVAPFIMVMAALVAVLRLQRHREFVAMVMTGRSPRRILLPVFVLTGLFVLVLVVVQEGIAPRVSLDRDRLQAELFEKNEQWVLEKVSVRDASGKLFVARDYNVSKEVIGLLDVSYQDEAGRNVHVHGADATWDEDAGGWRLQDGVSEVRLLGSSAPTLREDAPFVSTDVRPEDLLVDSREPFDLAWSDVLDLSRRYPNSRRYRLLRHYHVTNPLSILLIVLLVLPFVLRHDPASRLRGLGLAILLCFGFKVMDAAVWDLGSRGFLPPALAAWLPVIVAGSLVTVLFDSMDR